VRYIGPAQVNLTGLQRDVVLWEPKDVE
jgi:hypothetical protein